MFILCYMCFFLRGYLPHHLIAMPPRKRTLSGEDIVPKAKAKEKTAAKPSVVPKGKAKPAAKAKATAQLGPEGTPKPKPKKESCVNMPSVQSQLNFIPKVKEEPPETCMDTMKTVDEAATPLTLTTHEAVESDLPNGPTDAYDDADESRPPTVESVEATMPSSSTSLSLPTPLPTDQTVEPKSLDKPTESTAETMEVDADADANASGTDADAKATDQATATAMPTANDETVQVPQAGLCFGL